MTEKHLYAPIAILDQRLLGLVPKGDTITYTSRATIWKTGFGGDKKYGHLILTENGIAFRASKGGYRGGFVSMAKGAMEGYIPYGLIYEFHNKGRTVRIKQRLAENPEDKRGWKFHIERCKEAKESKDSWKAREKLFGDFFEQLYRDAIGK